MTALTPHFTLAELTASSTAQRLGIDNTPDPEIVEHLMRLAIGLERVRTLLGHPLRINSGYRCPALNRAVGGAKASAHLDGFAADFTCPAYGSPAKIVQTLAKAALLFDQVIAEGTWVHISFAPAMRGLLMTAHFGPGGTTYTAGV